MFRKRIITSVNLLVISVFFVFIFSPPTSALTYQEDVPVSFTFNRSISVAVSSDLHIYNLTPGTNADSNIITVSTATNNATGYVLSATVGNGTHTNPTYNTTNITNKDNSSFAFSSLATNSSLANMSNSTDNTWGYSFSQDNGTNWTNYSGLPTYTGTPKELISTNSNAGINIKFKIGAKASSSQPSGEYTNIINFVAVTNAAPPTIEDLEYMQEFFSSLTSSERANVKASMEDLTPYQLTDSRDGKTYKIAKIYGANNTTFIWLLDNLQLDLSDAISGNITVDDTNTNATAQQLSCLLTGSYNNSACSSPYATQAVITKTKTTGSWANSYTAPYIATSGECNNTTNCTNNPSGYWDQNDTSPTTYGAGSGKIGIYYNYCAASAGSYCYAGGSGVDVGNTYYDIGGDICPAGWHLPTAGTANSNTEYGSVFWYNDWQAFRDRLSLSLSGSIGYNGPAYYQGSSGAWWSSTYYSKYSMYITNATSDSASTSTGSSSRSDISLPIRCVLNAS